MCSNYNVIESKGRATIKAWTKGVPFEDKALEQLNNIAAMPLVHSHIAVMRMSIWARGQPLAA